MYLIVEHSLTQMSLMNVICTAEIVNVCDVGKMTRYIKFFDLISSLVNSPQYRTVIGPEAVPKVMMQNVNDVLKSCTLPRQPYYVPLPK